MTDTKAWIRWGCSVLSVWVVEVPLLWDVKRAYCDDIVVGLVLRDGGHGDRLGYKLDDMLLKVLYRLRISRGEAVPVGCAVRLTAAVRQKSPDVRVGDGCWLRGGDQMPSR